MGLRTISNPTVVINNVSVAVAGNTVSFTDGLGEKNLVAQSAGGTAIQTVLTVDVSTMISMVKLSLVNTAANIDLIRSWEINDNNNSISITGDGLVRSFSNAVVTNEPEKLLSSDGSISVEFKSDAAV